MNRLFGVPVGWLAAVLVGVLALALAAIAVLALRNRVFVRLGVRNIPRRRGRSALIVVGLMLGTAIVAAALATGDTMSTTIRSAAVSALGRTDEVVAARGVEAALAVGAGGTGGRWFPEGYAARIADAAAPSGLVDGVAPVAVDQVALVDVTSRQSEPRVTLFATDPARMRGLGDIRAGGKVVSLSDLRPGEVYLNATGADKLSAGAGDTLRVLAGRTVQSVRVKAVVRFAGGATDGAGLLLPLAQAQRLLGKPGLVDAVFVSNSRGVGGTDAVVKLLKPTVSPLGLETDRTKQHALKAADAAGSAFMAFFTTFGSFSIAAGLLLIFLIFVMLATERRAELGIARAVGTRRRQLVQMFLFEGLAYDLVAAAVGALVGVAVAYGMVLVIAGAFSGFGDFRISYSVRPTSVVLAYAIGVLLTLVVVVFSARRVSRMNIVSAIRDLPDPPVEKARRRRWALGIVGILLGVLLVYAGVRAEDEIVLSLGASLAILSLVPIIRLLGLPERAAHTGAGASLVLWYLLPISHWVFGDKLKVNFSIFILGGLMLVIGATWTIMYNADLLLGAIGGTLGRIRRLAPVVRMSMAYPLRSLFRTGVTLAMFTLVVFTLVVGAITTGSFVNAFNDVRTFGGGFDVRATSSPNAPIASMRAALARAPRLHPADFRFVASQSVLPVKAFQVGAGAKPESYVLNGVDSTFLGHTTYRLAAWARGYGSAREVWRALDERRGLAVVDQFVVPRRTNWTFGAASAFRVHGFYLEDKTFAPVEVEVQDAQTGRHLRLKVIGVLSDSSPQFMVGIWTAQATLAPVFGDRVLPTVHLFGLRQGVDPTATAKALESAFLANGLQADSLKKLLSDTVAANLTFDRLIEGFMGLGLIVGVAALGVITARAVVERRQQIGVLRAIGFRKRMVQLSFLLESSFVAGTAILVGTTLGLAVAHNVITDARRTPSWENMGFHVPWLSLAVIFLIVYLVALATTLAPAVRASRIYPAEALRYQ
jgi:putative ABC transport system permease protein